MMSKRNWRRFCPHLRRLADAVNNTVQDSNSIPMALVAMKRAGFEVDLKISFDLVVRRADPFKPSPVQSSGEEILLTSEDKKFLRDLKINLME